MISDENLAIEIRKGNKELFGTLIDRYEVKLTRYVSRFIQTQEDVVDIVQNIFVKAYVHLQTFDVSRSFNAWIYRIAHNEAVSHLKKKGREKVSFLDFDTLFPHPFAKETADRDVLNEELKTVLETSLSTLSPKYREVLILYYYEELSYQEIAEVLRIPVATVGVRLRRAKAELATRVTSNHYHI